MNHRLKVEMCGKQEIDMERILYCLLMYFYTLFIKKYSCVQTLTSLSFMILIKISCDFFLGGYFIRGQNTNILNILKNF